MPRKILHRTVYTVEVLSEEPIPAGMSLRQVVEEAETGDFSMRVMSEESKKLFGDAARNAILAQGSDPAFFGFQPARGGASSR